MKNIKNYLFPCIPILGIYLIYKYSLLSDKRPFIFVFSAFLQALAIFSLILHFFVDNVSS